MVDIPSKTVVVADDHSVVRSGVISILERDHTVEIVAQANNGLEAISAAKQHQPDMLVLDAAMPLARGIEVFCECRRWSPSTAVTLFTGFQSASLLSDWLHAGVDGILLKTDEPNDIQTGFDTVLSGGHYVSPTARKLIDECLDQEPLTLRERQVLSRVLGGDSNSDIASRLSISAKTVEKHRASVMRKLGVHSVSELMVTALQRGLLDDRLQG